MPYVRISDRTINAWTEAPVPLDDPGILNYQITTLLIAYWKANGPRYSAINDISGACTEALAEFRRRVIVPYEDQKIAENGDLYT